MLGLFGKKAYLTKGRTWGIRFLGTCLIVLMTHQVAWADGMPMSPDNNANLPPTRSVSDVGQPAGAIPQGPFLGGSFGGTWYAFVDNTSFTLNIEQEGRNLKLAHTAIYDYGRRVDSSVGGVSMAGTVSGSIAYLEWKSGLSPDTGRATLEYIPGRPITLHWKIIDAVKKAGDQTDSATPTEVSYFLPASAYLIRK